MLMGSASALVEDIPRVLEVTVVDEPVTAIPFCIGVAVIVIVII
jgi:hypothetical protein